MRRVIKIGGSLLLQADLPLRLDRWIANQQPSETFAIVGGGEMIESVRRLDRLHAMEPSWVHWHCIDLLRTTFEWLASRLNQWNLVRTSDEFRKLCGSLSEASCLSEASRGANCLGGHVSPKDQVPHLIAVDCFYSPLCPAPLPLDWSTTTDAIAGWLAIQLKADELVLMKSCEVDGPIDLAQLACQGVVDGALELLQGQLPDVRLVNLAAE